MTSFQRNSILFIFFIVLAFALFSPDTSSAQTVYYTTECGEQFSIGSCSGVPCNICCDEYGCHRCCPCCTQCSCSGDWKEYKTDTTGCGPNVLVRECRSVCGPASACCSCGPCQAQCDPWEICEECGSWQKAERSCDITKAGLNMPECNRCYEDCLDKPNNPQYYDNPTYPNDICAPESGESQNNIYLPVKLAWDGVRGWGGEDGWREGETCPKTCSASCPSGCIYPNDCYEIPECVQSYQIKIEGEMRDCEALRRIDELEENLEEEPREEYREEIERIKKEELEISTYEKVLDKSEFIPPCSCMFRSNRTYQWQVKACCGANGTNCGAWSDLWSFTANLAPEPKSPYDPDWQGSGKAENLSQEQSEKLRWCEMEDQTRYEETFYAGEKQYRPLSYEILIYYSDKDLCHPELAFRKECPPLILSPDWARRELLPPDELLNRYNFFFTKKTAYAWQVAACKGTYGEGCSDYSQLWRFETGDWTLNLFLNNPADDSETPIGLPIFLEWTSNGANSFNYKIINTKTSETTTGTTETENITLDSPELSLDTVYSWTVQPCWGFKTEECEDMWFGPWFFKTTGQAPKLETMEPKGTDILLPVSFTWEAVPGAKSYVFKIQGGGLNLETPTEKPEFSIDYPDLKQETDYSWQVKTCAKEKEEVCAKNQTCCGDWSNPQTFRTFKLDTPSNLKPEEDGKIYTYEPFYNISWEPVRGARFYQYEVSYIGFDPEDPKKEECQALVGGKIVLAPNNITPRSSVSLPLKCWGEYQWQVRACLDENCEESGGYSTLQTFSFVAKEAPPEMRGWGLVPCGRASYDPSTPWDETERCQIKHIFIMFFLIIDFLLWKLIPLILVLLVLASGVIFYFSAKLEAPTPLAKVKSLWKAAGIGLGIIFFAWTIVSFFLTLFGYRVGVFGPWWQI